MLLVSPVMSLPLNPRMYGGQNATPGTSETSSTRKRQSNNAAHNKTTKRRKISTKQMKKWTESENERLLVAVKKQQSEPNFDRLNFDLVSKHVRTRTREQCRQRYNKTILEQEIQVRRGQWSVDEDSKLQALVRENMLEDGNVNWKAVKQESIERVRRNIKQCKERWENFLSPNVNNGPFSASEDEQILRLRDQNLGWSEISKELQGRSQDKIKSRYNTLINLKKRNSKVSLKQQRKSSGSPKLQQVKRKPSIAHHAPEKPWPSEIDQPKSPIALEADSPQPTEKSVQSTVYDSRTGLYVKPDLEDAKLLLNQAIASPKPVNQPNDKGNILGQRLGVPHSQPFGNMTNRVFDMVHQIGATNGAFVSSTTYPSTTNVYMEDQPTGISRPVMTVKTNPLYYGPMQSTVYFPTPTFIPNVGNAYTPPVIYQTTSSHNQQTGYFVPVSSTQTIATKDVWEEKKSK